MNAILNKIRTSNMERFSRRHFKAFLMAVGEA
jgi:hypothetical protein